MDSILVTAFMPFGDDKLNPTELILSALPDRMGDKQILKLLLPVEFEEAPRLAAMSLMRSRPSAVLMLGQAGGRAAVTPERVAINVMDARMPDNAGFEPHDVPVEQEGPAAYFSTLPIKKLVEELTAGGLPAAVSNSAGTYVCNAVMYGVLHAIAMRELDIPAGFIHVPFITLEEGIRAAEIILGVL